MKKGENEICAGRARASDDTPAGARANGGPSRRRRGGRPAAAAKLERAAAA
jgi:hypothetical protein